MLRKGIVVYLPKTGQIGYVIGFNVYLRKKEISHLICYITSAGEWQVFYQLMQQFFGKFQQIFSELSNYIVATEKNPTSEEVTKQKTQIQDLIARWADLNQYLGDMETNLAESLFRSDPLQENLTEEMYKFNIYQIIKRFGRDCDKILFALLSMQRVLFVGQDRDQVEQALTALISYYLHPSVEFWSEEKSEKMLVAGPPALARAYDKSVVIADFDTNRVYGGENNDFCATVIEEAEKYSRQASVAEGRTFFHEKLSSIFSRLKGLLQILSQGGDRHGIQLQEALQDLPMAELHLLTRMSRGLNPVLTETLAKYLDSKSRFQDFFSDLSREH
jgi:hypothetical protein